MNSKKSEIEKMGKPFNYSMKRVPLDIKTFIFLFYFSGLGFASHEATDLDFNRPGNSRKIQSNFFPAPIEEVSNSPSSIILDGENEDDAFPSVLVNETEELPDALSEVPVLNSTSFSNTTDLFSNVSAFSLNSTSDDNIDVFVNDTESDIIEPELNETDSNITDVDSNVTDMILNMTYFNFAEENINSTESTQIDEEESMNITNITSSAEPSTINMTIAPSASPTKPPTSPTFPSTKTNSKPTSTTVPPPSFSSPTGNGNIESPDPTKIDVGTVKTYGTLLVISSILLMILTAKQMKDYPDGLCAGCCNVSILVVAIIIKVITLPCTFMMNRNGRNDTRRPSYANDLSLELT